MRFILTTVLFLVSSLTYAEITEIPAEQLTDSYIRDTTIIVEQKKEEPAKQQEQLKDDLHIQVKPQSYSSAQQKEQSSLPAITSPNTDLERGVKPIQSNVEYRFLKQQQAIVYDHESATREQKLRKKFNIPYNQPIDFANINLPVSENGKYNLGPGKSYNVGAKSLEIRIPNTKGYNQQSFSSPDGVYDVEVTPSDLIFKFNLK